jgi:hypothetical protein
MSEIITDVTNDPALIGYEGRQYPGTLDQLVKYDDRVLRLSYASLMNKSVYEVVEDIHSWINNTKENK